MEERLFEANRARDLADAAMVSRSEWYRRMAAAGVSQPVGIQIVLHVVVYTDQCRVELDLELRAREIFNDWLPPADPA